MNELIEAARSRALGVLANALAPGAIIEPALRNSDGAVVFDPEGLRTPVRKDIARKAEGTWVTENLDAPSIRPPEPVEFIWRDRLKVTLNLVTWDYLSFRLSPCCRTEAFEGLRQWFLRWFDLEDRNHTTSDGLYGVVHFLSDPKLSTDAIEFIVDLGSAPIEALEDLLDWCADSGFVNCEIG